jgi:hypothetical protein
LNFYFKEKIMISPSYSLTATERVLPRMALDFTTALLDARVTFTRTGNTATVTNSSGVIVGVNANLPRFDFDPTTLVCKGLLIEEARTNVLLNSLIDGTSLTTQLVTVTAAARTLSFYGTGTVVLSGAHSATVVGTGAYPTRTTLTFTPSAGSLTLTVTGTVQFAQLETGAFPTSYIPTEASQVTRTADVATMTGTNFSDWFNATEGSFFIENSYSPTSLGNNGGRIAFRVSDGTVNNQMTVYNRNGTANGAVGLTGGAVQFVNDGTAATGDTLKSVFTYKTNSINLYTNASSIFTDNVATIPTVNSLSIGENLCGYVRKIMFYTIVLIPSEARAFSK